VIAITETIIRSPTVCTGSASSR